jgi:predicted  nucleic acid-binding Zn-ribbon protein
MKPSRKNQLAHKLVVLVQLQLELLDELKPTTERMQKYQADLVGFSEELNNAIADTDTVQRSTYFQDLANKVDTVIRRNFDGSK